MSANQKLSPLLVEAKNSYIYQIADIMAPFVVNTVNMLYAGAKKEAGFGKPTKKFQMKLHSKKCFLKRKFTLMMSQGLSVFSYDFAMRLT